MRNVEKYIELLEDEIYQTVVHEIADGELSYDVEKTLHVLFENHKHAERFLENMKAEYAGMAAKSMHHSGMGIT